MTRSLVSELKTLTDVYKNNNETQIKFITETYKKNFDYVINVLDEEISLGNFERKYSPMDRSLRRN